MSQLVSSSNLKRVKLLKQMSIMNSIIVFHNYYNQSIKKTDLAKVIIFCCGVLGFIQHICSFYNLNFFINTMCADIDFASICRWVDTWCLCWLIRVLFLPILVVIYGSCKCKNKLVLLSSTFHMYSKSYVMQQVDLRREIV